MSQRRHQLPRQDDSGSIILSALVVITLSIVAVSLLALLAFQSVSVTKQQSATDANQAAYNALVTAIDTLAVTYPTADNGDVALANDSSLPLTPPAWDDTATWTEQPNTQARWWVERRQAATEITVIAEGRAGVGTPAAYRYTARLTYDMHDHTWRTTSIIGN